ncbi:MULTISPECIES: glycine--tRNA ligase subunit beta [unclassified Streptococcus]|uniref:glycine--tRNA ligase subunit beta n=1 Tax=unclassified Streptococcus TaxID=2608887 RepID=UPI0010723C49|nr:MULTISPECIES: glycine--tRNA ligase subunit beta [unclassified Streptococcus]MBF0806707.1 glycine--tRNA ligase subunit beta [Streptococcus sp. 19428wA2_WM07]TFU26470.1 glycine--tRNA ligase subunit beta [Streptococcus sp. WM07]
MTKTVLLELGLEEMPAYLVTRSMEQLGQRVADFLKAHRLDFEKIETFSTPRRLAVRVKGLADRQTDLVEDFKGPSKKIALDADGQFTKAAEGFVRGKGLTTDAIRFEEIKGEEYVYVTKEEKGQAAEEILPNLTETLEAMTFPVSMHWANYTFEYIRPVHTLTLLVNDQLLEARFLNLESGRVSRGHRFLGQEVTLASADSYEEDLRQAFVIADPAERTHMIMDQIAALEQEHGVQVEIDSSLLNEVLNLVEYPTAFLGSFDPKYLDLPEEVLVTSMKAHQRYFVVRDQAGKLLPHFVSVRNGNAEHLDNVIKGNEKVLVARLEDGEFFWKEDQKLAVEELLPKLAKVTFHEKIGSLSEHMERTASIAAYLATQVGLTVEEQEELARAAQIYKFDLLTGMVGEFDELQGIMGEKYALLAGEKPAVAQAIREHYLPNSSEGVLPESRVGAILAVADKMDTLLSFFTAGLIPSGSNDPYALRRATQGIVRILAAFGWDLDLQELQDVLYQNEWYQHKAEVLEFFNARIEKMMDATINKDIIRAVLSNTQFKVSSRLLAAKALAEAAKGEGFKEAVENLSRVFNLAEKADQVEVDSKLLESDSEKALAEAVNNLSWSEDMNINMQELFDLAPLIADFFENNMVMAEDLAVRANRLALLALLRQKASRLAHFTLLQTK